MTTDPKSTIAIEVLREIESGTVEAFTSFLTWDVVVWAVSKLSGRIKGRKIGWRLIAFQRVRFIPIIEEIVRSDQAPIEGYTVDSRDALHCSAAILQHLPVFRTALISTKLRR